VADFVSFIDRFRSNVHRTPEKPAFVHLHGSGEPEPITYAELDAAARSHAVWLRARFRPRDRALLLHPAGLEFIRAFLGCLYAALVPIPAPLPGNDRRQVDRTMSIASDAAAALVLTTADAAEALDRQLAELAGAHRPEVVASGSAVGDPAAWVPPVPTADTLAFLQYTSGSTSDPKGVMVTHGSLAHNVDRIRRYGGVGPDDVVVAWLPHFHDMGLVGTLLHPIHTGVTTATMSPMTFLKRPVRWLAAMSEYRCTYTTAPDFAYDLCARAVPADQVAGLDLSSLRWLLNGAEPVRATTMARFSAAFASTGFRAAAFAPCYGMAEATLMATANRPGSPPAVFAADAAALERDEVRRAAAGRALPLVGSGPVDPGGTLVVDPDDHTVRPAGQIGEIWLGGPSVTAGYWRRPEATAATFGAYTADGAGPFLRTGDLGAVVDGELFVTGRRKDMLIVHGRNLYPQDIEHTVRDVSPALASGSGAVFAVTGESGREQIVVIHEVKKGALGGESLPELAARVRLTVARAFEVPAPAVVLTNRGVVQRTTSGKAQRGLMRTLFLERRIPVLHEDVPPAVDALRDLPGDWQGGQVERTPVQPTLA
jgi:acyl-CoA synthetase (AMP-forming)/AMP-acid ligase II